MLQDFFEDFVKQKKVSTDDGFGGQEVEYVDNITFKGGISTNNSMEAKIAEKDGLKKIYTLVTELSTMLTQDDRVKKVSDGKLYRVTSDSSDTTTPAIAVVQYRQVDLELIEV